MIRAYFGLERLPFDLDDAPLLPQQHEVYDTLRVHNQQGGLCLLLGVPGTGKTVTKDAIKAEADQKRLLVVTVARTLHTYTNTIKILCEAFKIDHNGTPFKCERRLIEEAHSLNRQGKAIVIIIDDAHLLGMNTFRKLRLLFEDFPKNHNVILMGQPPLMDSIMLTVNEDIRSRVTYSHIMKRMNPDDTEQFIFAQLDRAGLGHNTFTQEAVDLIVRSSDGVPRLVRNLCISSMHESIREQKRTIDIDQVNRVLIQPHWRRDQPIESV